MSIANAVCNVDHPQRPGCRRGCGREGTQKFALHRLGLFWRFRILNFTFYWVVVAGGGGGPGGVSEEGESVWVFWGFFCIGHFADLFVFVYFCCFFVLGRVGESFSKLVFFGVS